MLYRNIYRKIVPIRIREKVFLYVRTYLRHWVQRKTNKTVPSGPFRGMKIDLDDIPMSILLGIHEKEIHPAFDKLAAFHFDQIINAGATEGYYAVGMALKWPQATVYAFDTQEDVYRAKISKLASDNLVANRVHIRGHCGTGDLSDLLKPDKSTLLMLDVEGDEVKLLDPEVIEELRRVSVIVELHSEIIPGCSNIIEERFRDTHNISKYVTRTRTIKDFPLRGWNIINPLIGPFVVQAMMERSAVQEFFLMIPKK